MKAVIWTKDMCVYCTNAKKLFELKDIEYTEKKIGHGYTREDLLEELPNVKTVPQIYIDDEYVGGYDQLVLFLNK